MQLNDLLIKRAAVMFAAITIAGLTSGSAFADSVVAYSGNSPTGAQNFMGNLGLDFDVTSTIQIAALGAYDSGGDSISPSRPVTVGIFERNGADPNTPGITPAQAPIVFETITGGTLIDDFRFVNLSTPLTLGPGYYSIVAVGFGDNVLNGNENVNSITGVTPHAIAGINYVGSGRFDENTSLDYPVLSDSDQGFSTTDHVFAAGNFAVVPLPAAAGIGFSLLGGFGSLTAVRRRFIRRDRIA